MIWFDKLLPKSKAFRLSAGKQITEFFQALENSCLEVKDYITTIYLDIWPQTTRTPSVTNPDDPDTLGMWEEQFALYDSTPLTEQERRDRLEAAWKRNGGQSPFYIQNTLQEAGFDVYIHEWWEPGTEPPVARNPNDYIIEPFVAPVCREILAICGEASAQCTGNFTASNFQFVTEAGEAEAEAGNIPAEAGNFVPGTQGLGYILVNKISQTVTTSKIMQCDEPLAEAGEPFAEAGEDSGFEFFTSDVIYEIPEDENAWPYFLYFGGPAYLSPATVPLARKEEFEELLLSICPAQQWLALLIIYT